MCIIKDPTKVIDILLALMQALLNNLKILIKGMNIKRTKIKWIFFINRFRWMDADLRSIFNYRSAYGFGNQLQNTHKHFIL